MTEVPVCKAAMTVSLILSLLNDACWNALEEYKIFIQEMVLQILK